MEGGNQRIFVEAWFKDFGSQVVGCTELFELINKYDLPIDLGNRSDKGQRTRLGAILSSLKDRQFGDYRIVLVGTKKHAKQWQLEVVNLNQGSPEVHHEVHHGKLLNQLNNMELGEPGEPILNPGEKNSILKENEKEIDQCADSIKVLGTPFKVHQVHQGDSKKVNNAEIQSLIGGEPMGEPQIHGSPEVHHIQMVCEAVNPAAGKVLEATAQYSWMEALNEIQEQ